VTTMEFLCYGSRKYISKSDGREHASPLENDDHPVIDTTAELDTNRMKKYQSMIGYLH
jgi:hypothetical protein